jgi:TonB family protein
MSDHPVPEPTTSTLQGSGPGAESDLGELASLFAAHGGGNFSAEVSAQLALEIVLNEIVEQACLATGATGAAIVLIRDGEMVCRASSGANAPVLGSPLGSESGLTAECIKTRKVQRCDDAQDDPRADAEASRSLGVRSVMILPLLRKDELAGVLEVFSSRPGAFGDRDEVTLEALAQRILKNLERASEPSSLISKAASLSSDPASGDTAAGVAAPNLPVRPIAPMMPAEPENLPAGTAKSLWEEADVLREIAGRSARGRFDFVGLALIAAVLACAVLLGTLMGVRMGWRRAVAIRGQVTRSASGANRSERNSTQSGVAQNGAAQGQAGGGRGMNAGSVSASPGPGNGSAAESEKKGALAPEGTPAAGLKDSFPPAGSLVVYDNGKEIFRLPPTVEGEAAQSDAPGEVQRASAVEPERIVKLSPELAQGRLVHRVEPDYPEEARKQGIQGAVVLEVHIGRDGAIQNVKVVSGQPLLANAAIAAVKQWRFKPHLVQGQPVEMQTRVTLNFRSPG